MATHAAVLENVRKEYGEATALDGLDLVVPEGGVLGLLGPNGAGKTTAVRILATLLQFDSGRAEVAGYDVVRQAEQVRDRIGLTGQYAAIDEPLSGRQNLIMFGQLFGLNSAAAKRRADELLERFSLSDAADRSAGKYSGGMRRRLDLAASMIRTPYILFLDEPTTGLDPRSRNELWDAVRSLVAEGTTVLLTTQYMEEADQLADRISVIDAGRVVAEGTGDDLKTQVGGDRIEVVVHDASQLAEVAGILRRLGTSEPLTDPDLRRASTAVDDRMSALTHAVEALRATETEVEDISLRRPTLDEAFLHLTGHHAQEEVVA